MKTYRTLFMYEENGTTKFLPAQITTDDEFTETYIASLENDIREELSQSNGVGAISDVILCAWSEITDVVTEETDTSQPISDTLTEIQEAPATETESETVVEKEDVQQETEAGIVC